MRGITALLVSLLLIVPTHAGDAVPGGARIFCYLNADQCIAGGPRSVAYAEWAGQIEAVNRSVNRSIRVMNEPYSDRWKIHPARGDCDDYVVSKRADLAKAGVPLNAMRVAVVETRNGEGHAILLIDTDQGTLALDNLTDAIKPVEKVSYRFVTVSGAHLKEWALIDR